MYRKLGQVREREWSDYVVKNRPENVGVGLTRGTDVGKEERSGKGRIVCFTRGTLIGTHRRLTSPIFAPEVSDPI